MMELTNDIATSNLQRNNLPGIFDSLNTELLVSVRNAIENQTKDICRSIYVQETMDIINEYELGNLHTSFFDVVCNIHGMPTMSEMPLKKIKPALTIISDSTFYISKNGDYSSSVMEFRDALCNDIMSGNSTAHLRIRKHDEFYPELYMDESDDGANIISDTIDKIDEALSKITDEDCTYRGTRYNFMNKKYLSYFTTSGMWKEDDILNFATFNGGYGDLIECTTDVDENGNIFIYGEKEKIDIHNTDMIKSIVKDFGSKYVLCLERREEMASYMENQAKERGLLSKEALLKGSGINVYMGTR